MSTEKTTKVHIIKDIRMALCGGKSYKDVYIGLDSYVENQYKLFKGDYLCSVCVEKIPYLALMEL